MLQGAQTKVSHNWLISGTVLSFSLKSKPSHLMDDNFTPQSKKQCFQSKCKAIIPFGYGYKTCQKCQDISKHTMQMKRKREKSDNGQPRIPPTCHGQKEKVPVGVESDTDLPSDDHSVSNHFTLWTNSYISKREAKCGCCISRSEGYHEAAEKCIQDHRTSLFSWELSRTFRSINLGERSGQNHSTWCMEGYRLSLSVSVTIIC